MRVVVIPHLWFQYYTKVGSNKESNEKWEMKNKSAGPEFIWMHKRKRIILCICNFLKKLNTKCVTFRFSVPNSLLNITNLKFLPAFLTNSLEFAYICLMWGLVWRFLLSLFVSFYSSFDIFSVLFDLINMEKPINDNTISCHMHRMK